ncbi:MAG: eukaryotic-like serine/threonine-protein kinase [Thermoleophilaceae bacterium]|nr:eukaryotic-like serine/threonine-protein kinase [Thermoleophilaceae bacterium]
MVTPQTPDLVPGSQLGRYRIEGPISSGAMGAVYRAHNIVSGTDVAIKRMLDTQYVKRFEIEARLLLQLEHPRVVKVLDHFQDSDGVYYIVMDLIPGTDLGRVLEERGNPGLPVDEVLEWARQVCEALQYVHAQQIVHRDVKPQNLIEGENGIVLVDFGVATQLNATDTGTVGVGTPRFMAPEVFAGGAVSARSDVFSLGATVWNLLAGSAPVYADDTKLADQVEGVTPELEQTLRASLEIIPERRIASIQAFAAALGAPVRDTAGASLALSVEQADAPNSLIEAVVRTAAGIFDAAAASIALTDRTSSELVFQAAWGAGAREIVGVRLSPGVGIAGAVVEGGEGQAVPECRNDPRFATQIAAGTGYVPHTMVVVPLKRGGQTIGVLSILDRRDGSPYTPNDVTRAELFAELAIAALDIGPSAFQPSGAHASIVHQGD